MLSCQPQEEFDMYLQRVGMVQLQFQGAPTEAILIDLGTSGLKALLEQPESPLNGMSSYQELVASR